MHKGRNGNDKRANFVPVKKMKYKDYLNQPENLVQLAKYIRARLRKDWDIVIAITGEEGSGKSTLAIALSMLIDDKFDLERNVVYIPDAEELKKEFMALKQYQCYLVDEAIRAAHKYKWHDALQQKLTEIYATERFQNKATLLLIPNFQDLTKSFRDYRVKLRIHVFERGHAMAFVKDPDKDALDPWHINPTIEYKKKMFKNKPLAYRGKEKRLAVERKTINYFTDLHWEKLPEDVAGRYLELKTASRKVYEEKAKEEPTDKWHLIASQLAYELKEIVGYPYVKIAQIIGKTDKTAAALVKKYNHNRKPENRTTNGLKLVNKHSKPPVLSV